MTGREEFEVDRYRDENTPAEQFPAGVNRFDRAAWAPLPFFRNDGSADDFLSVGIDVPVGIVQFAFGFEPEVIGAER